MNAIAPGKVILSGEHSVVYGAPAIAMAVSESIQARFSPDNSQSITIDSGEGEPFVYLLARLPELQQQLNQRYSDFEAGRLPVDKIMDLSQTLLLYALSHFDKLPAGTLTTESTLPTGAGMGSSAAAIAATLVLAEQLSGQSRSLQERFTQVRYCERLQHGRGSAIDAAAVTHGGLIQVQNAEVTRLECHLGTGWYRINSGRPIVSTGECVAAVREDYADSPIWSEFADITRAIPGVLNQPEQLTVLLRNNQQLLQQIGVVPKTVAEFIRQVELLGGAAKISGAGANRGERGGLILAYLPDRPVADLHALCNQYNYQISALTEDREGARSI